MTEPRPGAEPSFRRGLRTGVSAFNVAVGGGVALVGGTATLVATRADLLPDLTGHDGWWESGGVALGLFTAITAFHTALHAYFGWRFGRGLAAHRAGDHARAARLLAPIARAGMEHYDEGGIGARTLTESRARCADGAL